MHFIGGPIGGTYSRFDKSELEATVAALPSVVQYWPRGHYVLHGREGPYSGKTREAHWVSN